MKKVFMATLVAAAILLGCEKNSEAPVYTDLTGSWKYIGYSGGFAGFRFMPVDTLESYVQADTVGARILFNNGGTQHCTTYSFEKAASGYLYGMLTLNDTIMGMDVQYDVALHHDTLTMYPHNCNDCFELSYKANAKHFDWCTGTDGH